MAVFQLFFFSCLLCILFREWLKGSSFFFLNQNRKNYLEILGNKEKVQSPELDVPLTHSDVIREASIHVVSSVA